MLNKSIKGFTLIELLVVITIIGILATGAVTVYTSQIQKARDTTRINDVKALQSGIEQVYQDAAEYPDGPAFFTDVSVYVPNFPSDPKHGQPCNNGGAGNVDCGYSYLGATDNNGIQLWEYEVSTAFENPGNLNSRAADDNGNDPLRWEAGLDTGNNITAVAANAITPGTGACALSGTAAAGAGTIVIINWNPATWGNECG